MLDWLVSLNGRRVALTLPLASLVAPTLVLACPLCKDALSGDPVGTALSATTLVLIAIPSALVASIGGWIAFTYWRADRQGRTAEPTTAAPPSGSANHPVW